jgi:hypothetical protein
MAEEAWIPLESDGRWAGGFCHLLRECLEAAGVGTDRVSYKGRTVGPLDQSAPGPGWKMSFRIGGSG